MKNREIAVIPIYQDNELVGFAHKNGHIQLYVCSPASYEDVKQLLNHENTDQHKRTNTV